jgi:hypothetical protein
VLARAARKRLARNRVQPANQSQLHRSEENHHHAYRERRAERCGAAEGVPALDPWIGAGVAPYASKSSA